MRSKSFTFPLFVFLWIGASFTAIRTVARAQPAVQKPVNPVSRRSQADSIRIEQLLQQCNKHFDFNIDSSLYYAQQSAELAKAVPSRSLQKRAYVKLGTILFKRSDFDKSLAAFQQVERLSRFRQPDSSLLRSRVYTAILARTRGDQPEGLRLALSALKLYEDNPTQFGREVALLFTELGVIYDYMHDYPKALTFHQRRLRFSEQSGSKRELILALSNLGYFYFRVGQLGLANQLLNRSLAIAYSINNNSLIYQSLESLGEIAFRQKRILQSVRYQQAALKLARISGNKEEIGIIFYKLAQNYSSVSNYALADNYIRQAVHVLRTIRSAYHLQTALTTQSRILERMNRLQEALHITRQAHLLADSLTGAEKQKTIARLQATYDMNRKQQQIATLNKNLLIERQATRTATLELELTRQQRLFLLVVALLLGLLLAGGFASYRKQQRTSTILQQQKDELAQQAHEMAALNKTKDKLLSLISHDLRAPLGRLKFSLTTLHEEAPAGSALQDSLAQLDNQTDHVLALLTNLLDWSFHQMKGFSLHKQSIDLYDLLTDIVSQSALHLKQKKIQLINRVAPQTLVYTDKYQLACVIRNLFSNAIKFSTEAGIIRLRAVRDEAGIQLFIQDTGIGMSDSQLSRLLTDPEIHAGTNGEPGTGLGLQLCRELMANLSGTIYIVSHPDRGTTVQICLPAK